MAKQVEQRCAEMTTKIVGEAALRATDPKAKKTVELVDDLSNELCSAADLVVVSKIKFIQVKFKILKHAIELDNCLILD